MFPRIINGQVVRGREADFRRREINRNDIDFFRPQEEEEDEVRLENELRACQAKPNRTNNRGCVLKDVFDVVYWLTYWPESRASVPQARMRSSSNVFGTDARRGGRGRCVHLG